MLNLNSNIQQILRIVLPMLLAVSLVGCSSCVERPYARDGSPDLVGPTVIYLVRHAEKQASDEKDPALSEVGMTRARALAQMLSKVSIDGLFASDYQRTRLTLKPLAKQKSLRVNSYDASDSVALVETILSSYAGNTVVVAGHSNTIPELVALLGRANPLDNEAGQVEAHLGHNEYDRLFVVVRYTDRTPVTLNLSFSQLPEPASIHSH